MKTIAALTALALLGLPGLAPAQPVLPPDGIVVIDTSKVPREPDPVFRIETFTSVAADTDEITSRITATVRVLQGKPERFALSLSGDAPVTSLEGDGIVSWAERRAADGARFLEIAFAPTAEGEGPKKEYTFTAVAAAPLAALPAEVRPTLPGPGDAAGFSGGVTLADAAGMEWQVLSSEGLAESREKLRFTATGDHRLTVRLLATGARPPAAEMRDVRLTGHYDATNRVVSFVLEGTAVVREAGARLPLLAGRAAITGSAAGAGWRLELNSPPPGILPLRPGTGGRPQREDGRLTAAATGDRQAAIYPPPGVSGPSYTLAFDGAGLYPVRILFDAAAEERAGWTRLNFRVPSGTVVKVEVQGLPENAEALEDAVAIPDIAAGVAAVWLPASGVCDLGWRVGRESGVGRLFVNSSARVDVAVGPGLVRQESHFELRILQGQLPGIAFALEGEGEITEVTGTNVAGWRVVDAGEARRLEVTLSRPLDAEARFQIRSQSALAGESAHLVPLRITPEAGEVRHSGFLRIRNDGAVRFEAGESSGLMQLAPAQWPGAKDGELEGVAQVEVFRFPTPEYRLALTARMVFPEVSVNQVTTYEFAESDRVISARLELDVREAPLREWEIEIPDGYAVAALEGKGIADQIPGEAKDGYRPLRVVFAASVEGRALVLLRLERGEAAAAGPWKLAPLRFPGARSVRGFIGVAGAPGYRIAPERVEGLAEIPLGFFPDQPAGLQQAFRQREPGWSAALVVELLGQSVTADLFHLYSLKEGVAYGSVVMNFFIVGAPVNEWRIAVPKDAGNLVIDGQDVQSWRREDGNIVVSLSRPALGASTLLATFEHPMSARGGTISAGGVRPEGVASERGFVQIVSPLQVKSAIRPSGGLLQIEPNELPPELQLLSSAPSLAVFQYGSRPFDLAMEIEWFAQAESIPQVVDFAKLDTRVARDGQVVTDARYFVKTRGVGALRLELPAGATLWEVRVDGASVNARAEEGATLVPLPAGADPDAASEVSVRYGWTSRFASRIRLAAPEVAAPVLATEWRATADAGRVLVPGSTPAASTSRTLTETGFEWLASGARALWFYLIAGVCAGAILLARSGWNGKLARVTVALAWFAGLGLCVAGALAALALRGVNRSHLDLIAPVAGDSQPISVTVWNLPGWLAMISWSGLGLLCLGFVALLAGMLGSYSRTIKVFGWAGIAAGLLLQHGGAPLFFAWVGLSLFVALVRPVFGSWGRAAAALALLWLPGAGSASGTETVPVLQSVEQTLRIDGARAEADATVIVDAQAAGESFLLLKSPAVLTEFAGEGVRVTKVERDGGAAYYVVAEQAGRFTATLRYRMVVGDDAFVLPTGPAAINVVSLRRDQPGWGFSSPQAVRVEEIDGLPDSASGARLVLAPAAEHRIRIHPKTRDATSEELVFFAETANLLVPGPGVIEGRHRVRVRVSQGQMREITVAIPEGFMVGDVSGAAFGGTPPDWNFDPDAMELRVALPVPQQGEFVIDLATQRTSGGLPLDLMLAPVRVRGAADEVGMLALAFGGDAQAESATPGEMTPVNFEDFDAELLAAFPEGERPELFRVFRFGQNGGSVTARVVAVDPEIRVTTRQVLSVGDERLLLAIDLVADIRRAGVFRLSFPVPEGFEVESVSGETLSHWAETGEAEARRVIMHLRGRTAGEQQFAITLTAPPVGAKDSWEVPRFVLDGAARSGGTLVVVPEKGLRLQAVDRKNVSQIDARDAGDLQPGSLAFRLLQADWRLALGIEPLDPWITGQMLHEVHVREGQARHRVALRFRVENAAVKTLQVELPGLDAEAADSVRAEGEAVADIVRVAESDTWEIRFRRGMLGEVPVAVEFRQRLGTEELTLRAARPAGVRQFTGFVTLRTTGRLDLVPGTPPQGWQKIDWNIVPAALRDPSEPGMPPFAFRVADDEAAFVLKIRRQEMADALKLRVSGGKFVTAFSPRGDSVTSAQLEVRASEKSTISLRLPESARLFQVSVNGEDIAVVRDGGTHLFYVLPGPDPTEPVRVEFAYEIAGGKRARANLAFAAPAFNVPLENVEWRVLIPAGWELDGHGGSMTLVRTGDFSVFGVEDYLRLASTKRNEKVAGANLLMSQAGEYLRSGEQDRARVALSRAAKTKGIDEATNEDARVQLRNLASQQAVLGLNTVRQKLYLDNRSQDASVVNAQIEQAARANPILQGITQFDFQQMDQFLEGNTLEETGALRRVAERIVSQQIATEPAPRAIALALPQRGTEAVFTRSVQVEGDRPLVLEIGIAKTGGVGARSAIVTLLLLIALGVVFVRGNDGRN